MTPDTTTHSYSVTGMSCIGCANKISAALQNVDGVVAATVRLNPPEASIETSGRLSVDALNEAIMRVGVYRLSEGKAAMPAEGAGKSPPSLYPLFLIVGYIAVTVGLVAIATGNRSASSLLNNFMAGFFLVFSFFKFLDLRGFSDAFGSYDLLARAVPGWGLVYPFIELALGVAYLLAICPAVTNVITLGLMLIGSVGVLRTLLNKRTIRCACLGTALALPMTTVTLVEDLGMAGMAAAMWAMYAR